MPQDPTKHSEAPTAALTSHAMLIPWGLFAQRIGVVEALEGIPISQRTRDHTPQTKLIEFLVSILAGCVYLQDISHGPHPLDRDLVTAQAWGQDSWADYSGVSRTLKACTEETAAAVREALGNVLQPFVEHEVMSALRDQDVLIYDGDLTGRPVSSSSTTYPGVAFGWMSDAIQLGYQAALVSMHSPTYGRIWLSVEHHPGDTVSASQVEAMVRAAEARTGARPHRRTDLLAKRIAPERALLQEEEAKLNRARERVEQAQERLDQVEQERRQWAQQVAELEASYQSRNRLGRPNSRLAQARRKLSVRERRLERRQRDLERARKWLERRQVKRAIVSARLLRLEQCLEQFIEDNHNNPWPIRAIFRLDGGFGSGPGVAMLIEMGYDVYTKAHNHQVVRTLRRRVTHSTPWTRVGKNAEMVAWEGEYITNCPYPLDVALERFHTGSKMRHAALLHYGAEPVTTDLAGWFTFYNGRQTIEAGIKEGKNVFQMHHLKVRSHAGLLIQEELAVFAANFVRLAAAWLDAPAPSNCVQMSVKQMVRVGANTSAWVIWQPGGCLLRFTELSAFAGTELTIGGARPLQRALPLFKSCVFSPI
jgi:hypothetical protein